MASNCSIQTHAYAWKEQPRKEVCSSKEGQGHCWQPLHSQPRVLWAEQASGPEESWGWGYSQWLWGGWNLFLTATAKRSVFKFIFLPS